MSKQFGFLVISVLMFAIVPSCVNERTTQTKNVSVREGVRAMADSLSDDLYKQGPIAWLNYFDHSSRFFMASDGKLQFPNYDSAEVLVRHLAQQIKYIQLTWSDVRVDSLSTNHGLMGASFHEVFTYADNKKSEFGGYFTGLIENTPSGWRVRDAHWSLIASHR